MTTDYVGRAQKYGIFQLLRRRKRFVFGHNRDRFRTGNGIFFKQRFKAFSIFRPIYAVCGSTQNTDTVRIEIRAKVNRRLTTKSDDNAVRLFDIENVLHVFGGKRFKIQSIRRVEVGGNRFGVIVDNRYFVAEFFQSPNAMHGRVVEFDTLTDTDRTRTDNDDTLFAVFAYERFGFVVFAGVESRIEIRRFRREFRRAGIYHFVRNFLSIRHFLTAKRFDILIKIAKAFPLVV